MALSVGSIDLTDASAEAEGSVGGTGAAVGLLVGVGSVDGSVDGDSEGCAVGDAETVDADGLADIAMGFTGGSVALAPGRGGLVLAGRALGGGLRVAVGLGVTAAGDSATAAPAGVSPSCTNGPMTHPTMNAIGTIETASIHMIATRRRSRNRFGAQGSG